MKLDILYTKDHKDREVKILNVSYISFFHNSLYYFVSDDPVVRRIDLNSVVAFTMIE